MRVALIGITASFAASACGGEVDESGAAWAETGARGAHAGGDASEGELRSASQALGSCGTWQWFADSSSGLSGNPRPISVGDDGTIYVASSWYGVFKSGPGGTLPFTMLPNTGLDNMNFTRVDSNAAGEPLIGCWDENYGGSGPHSLFRFDATMNQWYPAQLPTGTDPTRSVSRFEKQGANGVFAVGGWYPYIYRSVDSGASYQTLDLNNFTPSGSPSAGLLFSIAEAAGGELLVGSETAGFYHSLDAGNTWSSVDPSGQSPVSWSGNSYGIGFTSTGEVLFSRMFDWTGHLLYRRTAQGSFVTADDGLTAYKFNSTVNNSIRTIVTTTSGDNFIATTQGVFRAKDGGAWTLCSDGLPSAPSINVIAAYGNDVYVNVWSSLYVLHVTP